VSTVIPGTNFSGANSTLDDLIVKPSVMLANNVISYNGVLKYCVQTIGNEVDPTIITGSIPTGDTGFYNYQWQISTDNSSFNNITSAIKRDYNPLPISSTRYYRRIVTGSICANPLLLESNVIKIEVNVIPKADFVTPDLCLNDGTAIFTNTSTIIDGTSNQLTYSWNFGDPGSGALNISIQKDGAHTYSSTGNYVVILKVTSNNGCVSDIKSYPFTVNESTLDAVFSVVNQTKLCSDREVEFRDNAKVTFGQLTKIEWYYDYQNNPTVVVVDDNPGLRTAPKVYLHKYPTFNSPTTKKYKVRMVVYSGASATYIDKISQEITVHAIPEVEFSALQPVCIEQPAFQINQASEKFGIIGSGFYSGSGITTTGMFTPALAGDGTHTITYTYKSNAADCTDSNTQDITVNPSPVLTSANLEILVGGEIVLRPIAQNTGLSYQWRPSDFLSQANILTPIASPVETTTYVLTATDQITGCSAIGLINVLVHKKPEIPNVFTPNGDDVNDYWVINNLNTYTDCTVNVFNRYGKKIFNSIGYTTLWDGRFKDGELISGTYYYIIDPKKGRKPISGSVTILR